MNTDKRFFLKNALDTLVLFLITYYTNTKSFQVDHETMNRCMSNQIQTASLPFDLALWNINAEKRVMTLTALNHPVFIIVIIITIITIVIVLVLYIEIFISNWSDGLVVRGLDSQSRDLKFKTTRWLLGQLHLSLFRV